MVRSLAEAVHRWPLDLSRRVLDLAAGSGEADIALCKLGAGAIDATDPFTHAAYAARTGSRVRAARLRGRRRRRAGRPVVRADRLQLRAAPVRARRASPGVAAALSLLAPSLLVLTPHKRPVLRPAWGWNLAGEFVIERVRTRWYRQRTSVRDVAAPPAAACAFIRGIA